MQFLNSFTQISQIFAEDIHKINTLEIYNSVITDNISEQQNIMHFNVSGVKNTLLLTESNTKGLLKY